MEIIGKYGRATVMTEDIESAAVAQIYDYMNSPISKGCKCVIQSDVHAGSGCVVGFTMKMNPEMVDPEMLGPDISCGVLATQYKLSNSYLEKHSLELIDHKIRETIPLGMEANNKVVVNEKEFIRFLRTKLERSESLWPEMIHYEDQINEKWIDTTLKRLGVDPGIFWKQLGTLGGGGEIK